jgi:hypothetical protein
MTNEQARELGAHHGYQAANYAANVSGQPVREPARSEAPAMSDDAWLYYVDGWGRGVQEFQDDDPDGQ